ncbi:MAG TPA: alpha/beta fold hydrolase [Cyclobacteriaceae bacterium]
MRNPKNAIRKISWLVLILFLLINIVAFIHAYTFTHFSNKHSKRTKDPAALSFTDKLHVLAFGIDNPRPSLKSKPSQPFEQVIIKGDVSLGCWSIKALNPKGTVIMFHGYAGEKSSLLGRSEKFLTLGYNVLLVDFEGSGDSEGNSTSVGYSEASQVKQCYDYVLSIGEQNIYLFGTSMGSVAIVKAFQDFKLSSRGIIVECPFGSLYKTVCARFKIMGVPAFPMAALLTFWGGIQHGYWAFSHNPIEYAKSVSCPVLLLFGEKDNRVSREEIDKIYTNLQGNKILKTYVTEGHDVFTNNTTKWNGDVKEFLTNLH